MANDKTMFILHMNDMRSTHIESIQPVLWSDSRDKIKDFLKSERLEERWTCEKHYHHSYKKGTVLEWFNPPYTSNENRYMRQYTGNQDKLIGYIPNLDDLLQ